MATEMGMAVGTAMAVRKIDDIYSTGINPLKLPNPKVCA